MSKNITYICVISHRQITSTSMASVKVLLMEEKINKAGEAPVYLRIEVVE